MNDFIEIWHRMERQTKRCIRCYGSDVVSMQLSVFCIYSKNTLQCLEIRMFISFLKDKQLPSMSLTYCVDGFWSTSECAVSNYCFYTSQLRDWSCGGGWETFPVFTSRGQQCFTFIVPHAGLSSLSFSLSLLYLLGCLGLFGLLWHTLCSVRSLKSQGVRGRAWPHRWPDTYDTWQRHTSAQLSLLYLFFWLRVI